ncbi:MAG: hypothetical protein GYA22_11680 [Bacteroidales bacterium]|nr:hypothetical protein [Bacteroidales bacterium]
MTAEKHRRILFWHLAGFLLLTGSSLGLFAQEDIWEKMLREEVQVTNPVYKPVIGLGPGYLHFTGDIRNNIRNPLVGNMGVKFNVSTFLDNKHYLITNFGLIYGTLTGNQRSLTNPAQNLNFQSSLIAFALNLEYRFGHFYKRPPVLSPFVSVGVENFQFNTKGDLYDAGGNLYFYWDDGTIRNRPQGIYPNRLLQRDYVYETDLRELDIYGKGKYPENAFAIPFDAGVDFHVSNRLTIRMGHSVHFTNTDYLDNLGGTDNTSSNGNAGGNKHNDRFSFSYITMHLDLFSSPRKKVVEKMFANLDDFDYALYEDEDNDGVFYGWDKCPGTPSGIPVDSTGCPFDTDKDGVPDYYDKESGSLPGAIVDQNGVTIPDSAVDNFLALEAVSRTDAAWYWTVSQKPTKAKTVIPEKFRFIDTDQDGYLSFEEVIAAIDAYFDYKNTLTLSDLYELQDFFFSQ